MLLIWVSLVISEYNNFPVEYFEFLNEASINVKQRNHVKKRAFQSVDHDDEFLLTIKAFNKTMTMHLQPSAYNIPIETTNYNGHYESVTIHPKLFTGQLVGDESSIVSIHVQDEPFLSRMNDKEFHLTQFQGKIITTEETYHIKTIQQYNKLRKRNDVEVMDVVGRLDHERFAQMIVYRDSDKGGEDNWSCGVEKHMHDMPETVQEELKHSLLKRSTPAGCPGTLKELYIGFALDCSYIATHGGVEDATMKMLEDMNIVSKLFKNEFNVLLAIIKIDTYEVCQNEGFNRNCDDSFTISERLSEFSRWRGTASDEAGLWHLLSRCSTDTTVGLAWMGAVCTTNSISRTSGDSEQYYSGTGISTTETTNNDWVVIAHEIGHNFGAVHDCSASDLCSTTGESQCCQCDTGTTCDCNGRFIMNPSTSSFIPQDFSPCTKDQICSKMSAHGRCLKTPGQKPLFNLKVCGNGILEDGEECDTGGVESTCCSSNCTLTEGSACDDLSHGCCTDCQVASSTKVCRPSVGECDIEDKCDGSSIECPTEDEFKPDGTQCSQGVADNTYCASGICTNRDLQCILHEVTGLSDAIEDFDPIVAACDTFQGQCGLWCDSEKLPCRKLSGHFLPGTKCGENLSGVCTKDNVCTNPDTLGQIWQFVEQYQVYVIICTVLLLAFIVFSYDSYKRKRRKAKKEKRLKRRQKDAESYQVRASEYRKASHVDKSYYYEEDDEFEEDQYQRSRLASRVSQQERRQSFQPPRQEMDLYEEEDNRPRAQTNASTRPQSRSGRPKTVYV